MFLNYITLENIRSYEKETIEFKEGTTLLSGPVGAGKSTILQAIEFALFGIKKGITGEGLLRNDSNNGKVELCFECNGKEIIISRSLKRQSNKIVQKEGYIIIDNIKTDLMPEEMKARIYQLLGYPIKELKKKEDYIYRYTVYTPQEEMKKIIFEDPEERLETIRKIFGIDKYKTIKNNVSIAKTYLREREKVLEAEISGIKEKRREFEDKGERVKSLKNELEKISSQLKQKEENLKKIKEKKKAIEEKLSEISAAEKILQDKNNSYDEILKNIDEKRKRLLEVNEKSKELETKIQEKVKVLPEGYKEKMEKLNSDIVNLEKQKSVIESEIKKLEEKAKTAKENKEKYNNLSKELEELTKKLDELNKEINKKEELNEALKNNEDALRDLSSRMSVIESIISQSKKFLKDISNLKVCPTCKQDIDESHRAHLQKDETENINKLSVELSKIKDDVSKKNETISSIKKEIEDIRKKEIDCSITITNISNHKKILEEIGKETDFEKYCKELSQAKDILSMNEENLERTRAEYAEIRKKVEEASEAEKQKISLESLKKDKNDIENELKNLERQKNKISEEIKELAKKISEKPSLKGESEYVTKEHEAEEKVLIEMNRNYASLKKEKEMLDNEISKLDKEIKKMEEKEAALKNINEFSNWLEKVFLEIINNIERHVMITAYHEFNELFQEWFSTLIENETMNARLDETFSPVITQNSNEIFVENLSGGEKTACALAYRLALNSVINDVVSGIKTKDIIMLDEPTDGFSSEQLDKIREIIDQLNMRQVIIVSHEPKIESFASNIIRVEKSDGVSKVFS